MNRMPCTHCMEVGATECIIRETKRGTYARKGRRRGNMTSEGISPTVVPNDGFEADPPLPPSDKAAGPVAFNSSDIAGELSMQSIPSDQGQVQDGPFGSNVQNVGPSSETINSFPNERLNTNESSFHEQSTKNDGNASSYRDISWSAMFDHFLNNRKDGREFVDKCSITYLGESFPLAIVLDEFNDGGRPRLHHPGPPFPGHPKRVNVPNEYQPVHILPEDLDFLRIKGVFQFPEPSCLETFMTVFLDRVYPMYPIVNRLEFIQQREQGQVPLILLHSICFIAVTFCPLPVLSQCGFLSRREARLFYYKKVKALFDSGYEINKIVILQSAILMSFWGGGPNNYWNFYSWISTAVTIAEAMGLHRSTATTYMQPHDKSLLRRLWWTLVVRDSACSALVGRPFRIELDQSDTEMLTIEDFAHDATSSDFLEAPDHQIYALYQVQIAKLSLILRDIVISRYHPGRPSVPAGELHAKLNLWRSRLPVILVWDDDFADYLNPFSMTLSVQYNHHLILTYLGHNPKAGSCDEDDKQSNEIAISAAQHISTIACTAVTKSSILLMPHELFHGIFLAQAVFYTIIKSSNKLLSQLGRSALTNCQMVLHESRECWDPSPWIMQLFDNLSNRRLQSQVVNSGRENPAIKLMELPGLTSALGSTPEAGVFNGLLGYDPWQTNPMLSSLFDLPPEMLLSES